MSLFVLDQAQAGSYRFVRRISTDQRTTFTIQFHLPGCVTGNQVDFGILENLHSLFGINAKMTFITSADEFLTRNRTFEVALHFSVRAAPYAE
jgi:hypothetical protein